MASQPVYEALCLKGRYMQGQERDESANLLRLANLAQAIRPPVDIDEQLASAQARRDSTRIELSRHVAHCPDGCRRAPAAEQPPAFATQTPYERAPVRSKPPLPPVSEITAMIRAGQTVEKIAETFERNPQTIRQLVTSSGWSSKTGQPAGQDADEPASLHKPFRYEPWMDDGVCAQTDPEAFFPEKGGSTREAKAICGRCAVAAECLDYALDNQERFGIWGGLSERERRKIAAALKPTDFPIHTPEKEESA